MSHPQPAVAYIGLGANLDDPVRQVRTALDELGRLPGTRLEAVSPLYRTAPVGPPGQPDYVNAVARLSTGLPPRELLAALQGIERVHGRERNGTRWGPRPLDLDILLYDDCQIDEPGLKIPHPEIASRAFVLVPLADVAPPELSIPGQVAFQDLLVRCARDGVTPLA